MKQILAGLFIMVLVHSQAFGAADTAKKLVGEWKGTDNEGMTASLAFHEDGSAAMIQDGEVLDGKSIGGRVGWSVDDSKDPIQLDFILTRRDGTTRTLPMILRFISDTKIEVRMPPDMATRPVAFLKDDPDNQIVLTRQ